MGLLNRTYLIIFCLICFISSSNAQESDSTATNPKFFLECWECDFNLVRQELNFVSFVRDPNLADVHILSSTQRTGSGGRKIFLNFIGQNRFEDVDYDYEYLADQSETRSETRQGLLKIIKTAVLQYYSQTDFLDRVEIDLSEIEGKSATQIVDDPWNLWVISLEVGSNIQKEESQDEFSLNTEIRIQKVTDSWKTRIEGDYRMDNENYYDDGEKFENNQTNSDITANFIKSLNQHWSGGVFGEYRSSSYLNTKNSYSFETGIEYNIFPWSVSNRKIFVFRYVAGASHFRYEEITIYDKTKENLFYEALVMDLEIIQPWGRIESRIEGKHYFHDFSKKRLSIDSEVSLRITRQLSVYSEVRYDVIHDQLYLPKGNASVEDVLLRRIKMATEYEFRFELGFQFTFGSIYNNVVNERF
ncbi:hypothetical protein [Draconibacterium halophilum]|uniref:DUF481 domain-containing protein n=1 Tax=Draconibacterium halophilum TaxID=2706887 RepID=A0A6C0RFI4_9BACT|nr:hypothetical protein [Draconibacterium halophilum]QIA09468.1 hypothetical protein G0Q07_17930 [Draconibacterium halophilum]